MPRAPPLPRPKGAPPKPSGPPRIAAATTVPSTARAQRNARGATPEPSLSRAHKHGSAHLPAARALRPLAPFLYSDIPSPPPYRRVPPPHSSPLRSASATSGIQLRLQARASAPNALSTATRALTPSPRARESHPPRCERDLPHAHPPPSTPPPKPPRSHSSKRRPPSLRQRVQHMHTTHTPSILPPSPGALDPARATRASRRTAPPHPSRATAPPSAPTQSAARTRANTSHSKLSRRESSLPLITERPPPHPSLSLSLRGGLFLITRRRHSPHPTHVTRPAFCAVSCAHHSRTTSAPCDAATLRANLPNPTPFSLYLSHSRLSFELRLYAHHPPKSLSPTRPPVQTTNVPLPTPPRRRRAPHNSVSRVTSPCH